MSLTANLSGKEYEQLISICFKFADLFSLTKNGWITPKEEKESTDLILLLPREGILILFCKYCFHFTPEDAELFYHIKDGKARLLYYKKWLSYIIGIDNKEMISESNFKDASVMAMKKYLDHQCFKITDFYVFA